MLQINNQRIQYIDVLKGIGIILVVLAHSYVSAPLNSFIYSFHMPLFFFVSGYLFSYKTDKFNKFIFRKMKALLLPYFIFSLISLLIAFSVWHQSATMPDTLLENLEQLFYLNGKVVWNTPLWFLPCLFVVQLEYYFLKNKIRKTNLLILLLILSSIIGYFIKIPLPFGISISFTAIVFFGGGNLIRENLSKEFKLKPAIIYLLLCLCINIVISEFLMPRVDIYNMVYNNYFYFYMASTCGIVLCFIIAKMISTAKILEYLGKNSIIILVTHYLVIWYINIIGDKLLGITINSPTISDLKALIFTVIILLYSVPLIFVVNYYFPFLLGKSKTAESMIMTNINSQKETT